MATITRPSSDIIVTGNSSDIFEDIWTEDQSQGWGVFTRLIEGLYASTEIVVFGDGSTPTDVSDIDCCVKFDDAKYFYVRDNAIVTLGEKLDSETAVKGCLIFFNDLGNDSSEIEMKGTLNLYNTSIKQIQVAGNWYQTHKLKLNGAGEFIDSQLRFINVVEFRTIYTQYDASFIVINNGIKIYDDMTLTNVVTKDIGASKFNFKLMISSKTLYLINPTIGGGYFFDHSSSIQNTVIYVRNYSPTLTWTGASSMHASANTYQQQPFNIHVRDKDGNNLSGVTCLLEDTEDVQAFSVSTAGDGTITQQWVNYKTYDSTDYTTGGDTKTPHKLTMSKNGYKTLIIEEITMDELKSLEYELQPYGRTPV